MNCIHCNFPIDKSDLREWRWSGWTVGGTNVGGHGTPSRPNGVKRDFYDFTFHKECFPEWLYNRDGGMQDLDKPMNACIYFARTGSSMHGYYVRENKKHPVCAAWKDADIRGVSIFPTTVTEIPLDLPYVKITIDQPQTMLRVFQEFLNKHGWLEIWFEPRKQFEAKLDVYKKMQDKYLR